MNLLVFCFVSFLAIIVILYFFDFLVQNVPPAILLRFLREHRSEWADSNIDAYSAAAVKVGPCTFLGPRVGNFGGQVVLPLAQTVEHEEASVLNHFANPFILI